jgi:hypothetical protein
LRIALRGLGTTLVALLALAPTAQAATVSVESGALRVIAAPGEANQITVAGSSVDPSLAITDSGAPLEGGAGCAPGGGWERELLGSRVADRHRRR